MLLKRWMKTTMQGNQPVKVCRSQIDTGRGHHYVTSVCLAATVHRNAILLHNIPQKTE